MTSLLGGMSPASFLRDHWQKRPLLVRQAVPGFSGLLDRDALLALTGREDAISRLVIDHQHRQGPPGGKARGGGQGKHGRGGRWERHDGPFSGLCAAELPKSHWTVLVHGIESLVPGGWELLRRFSFLPAARIDDLMVSYAAHGGSVGPHDDRYDVFLLQGPGRRRWQINRGGDRTLDQNAAIKVLASFAAEEDWVLEPGDMLYLPPGVAHYGVAEGPCFTYSIGFLAPSHVELVQSFLGYLGGVLEPTLDGDALLADPELELPENHLAVGDAMIGQVSEVLKAVRWDPRMIEDFVGCFLTRPKPQVRFHPPGRPLSLEALARRLREPGRLTLALPSRGLVRGDRLFFNGEAHEVSSATLERFQALVRERSSPLPLVSDASDEEWIELLHGWYEAGYLGLQRGS